MASPNPYEVAASWAKATAAYAQLQLDLENMSFAYGEPRVVDAAVVVMTARRLTPSQWEALAGRAGISPLGEETRDRVLSIADIWATAEERQSSLVPAEQYLESAVLP